VTILRFIAWRLLQAIPLLFGVSLLTFFLLNLAPGDFLEQERLNPANTDERIKDLEEQFGLVREVRHSDTGEIERVRTGWLYQYGHWLWNVVRHNDWGVSFRTHEPVWDVISARALNTLWLSAMALFIGIGIAIPIGIYSACRQYRWQDMAGSFVSFVGLSVPDVFLALLVLMFAAATGWIPVGRMRSLDFDELTILGKTFDLLHHVIGPAFVLGTAVMATYMRQMRGNLLDVLEIDYIRTARAKGMAESTVVLKHGVRNAINPIITLFGYAFSGLLSGSVLVENVLAWPGLGRTVVEALFFRDMYLVLAAVMMASVLLIIGNLIADILLAINDPRIRLER
jgi:peptide/nickel transport system permease protein